MSFGVIPPKFEDNRSLLAGVDSWVGVLAHSRSLTKRRPAHSVDGMSLHACARCHLKKVSCPVVSAGQPCERCVRAGTRHGHSRFKELHLRPETLTRRFPCDDVEQVKNACQELLSRPKQRSFAACKIRWRIYKRSSSAPKRSRRVRKWLTSNISHASQLSKVPSCRFDIRPLVRRRHHRQPRLPRSRQLVPHQAQPPLQAFFKTNRLLCPFSRPKKPCNMSRLIKLGLWSSSSSISKAPGCCSTVNPLFWAIELILVDAEWLS